jgi:hypothetical protein
MHAFARRRGVHVGPVNALHVRDGTQKMGVKPHAPQLLCITYSCRLSQLWGSFEVAVQVVQAPASHCLVATPLLNVLSSLSLDPTTHRGLQG